MQLRSGTTAFPGWHKALAPCIAACFGFATITDRPVRPAVAQPPPASATAATPPQPVTASTNEDRLTQPQLEQLLAPVALYPDELLAQMLMAATYTLELVQVQRWLGREGHASLHGEALAQALQSQPWDASVKSLVPFPDVVKMMNDQLEWTQQLGDAVLAQQQDVLNAVQVLRNRAQQAGKLESGPQQTITISQNVSVLPQATAPQGGGAPSGVVATTNADAVPAVAPPPQIITIQPTAPDKVYVPAYNPSVVYGSWPYPSYPPPYYPPPVGSGVGNALLTGMAFAGGVALIGSLSGWAGCGWGSGNININSSRVANIDRSRTGDVGNRWQHNSAHRQGVAYRGDEVRNRYQGNRPDRTAQRDQFRGRVQQTSVNDRGGLGDRGGPGNRGGLGDRNGLGDRGGPGAGRDGPGDRVGTGRTDRPGAQAARTAGAGRGAGDRAAPAGGNRSGGIGQAPSGRPREGAQSAASGRPASAGGAQGFQGMGQGGDVRAASQRGQASRQSRPTSFASAGSGRAAGGGGRAASAGGGGGRGGGGRRGR
jgi:Protein of unknown function (DUF3300)